VVQIAGAADPDAWVALVPVGCGAALEVVPVREADGEEDVVGLVLEQAVSIGAQRAAPQTRATSPGRTMIRR